MLKKISIGSGVIVALAAVAVLIYLFVIAPSFIGNTGIEGVKLQTYITPEKLKELTENPRDDIWIIDVRPEADWKKGHIPTSKSFSSSVIESRLAEIPKDKYLIIHCETGGRVDSVIRNVLKPHGYTRYINWGGFFRWPYETITE